MSEKIASEMNEISLTDAVSFIVDNRGKTVPIAEDGTGITLIATNCISNEHLYPLKLNVRYISKEIFESWFRAHPKPDDIIITNKGSNNGEVCLVPNPVNFCIAQDMVALRADSEKIYPYYLFASLRSSLVQRAIKRLNVDAVIPHFKKTDFDKLFIPLPSREVQKFIGDLYMLFSSKIENLRRQNETLERIAQTLFKHWFVDFEFPNEDGKPYKSSGGEMVRSELGEIPAGWHIGKLGDVVNVNAKSISNGYKHTNIEYVDISSVGIGNLEGTSSYRLKDAPSRARRLVTHGDVIWSGVRPNRKSYLFISHPSENLVVSTGFITLAPNLIPSSYLYSWVTTDSFVEYLTFNASGSAYPAVKAEHFEIADVLLPEKLILNKFHGVVDPMREKIHQNALQIQTLTKTREVLLPKLMGGKLRITAL